jgi:Rho GTPase-activating protein 1
MDAHNLALVLCPNLISGNHALRDVSMCMIPSGPVQHESMRPTPSASSEGKTTLGTVIKVCIQRYYEIFDEVRDRSEAVPPRNSSTGQGPASSEVSSNSGSLQQGRGGHTDDDEDIDDAMLVMPIGPNPNAGLAPHVGTSSSPPSAWGTASTYKPRHRDTAATRVRSMHTMSGENENGRGDGNGTNGHVYASMGKSKSMISIEKGRAVGTTGRKGSISVGRGTTRKSSGAGVEAISITAEGFFSAPSSSPRRG